MNFPLAVCLAMTLVVTYMARSELEFTNATPTSGVVGLAFATFSVLGALLVVVNFRVPCALASIFGNNSRAGQDCGLLAERVMGLANGRWHHACIGGGSHGCCFQWNYRIHHASFTTTRRPCRGFRWWRDASENYDLK
ncbi:hypothetical protein HanPI659440_Chr08g0311231 [Helianthus annuus]|nr:hypothetical protein HanPI659440_Chr08g0311231 [Helianthus annuus]